MIVPLSRLVELKRCDLRRMVIYCVPKLTKELISTFKPFLKIIPALAERLCRTERPRLRERMAGIFDQKHSIGQDVDEEITPEPQLVVHVLEAVIDEADGRSKIAP